MSDQAAELRHRRTAEAALSVVTGGRGKGKRKSVPVAAPAEDRAYVHTSMHITEEQLQVLRAEAFARVQAGGSKRIDTSGVLRDLIEWWRAQGCPPVSKP